MRTLALDRSACKALERLPAKPFRQVVSAVFALLKEPRPSDSLRLSGSPFHRISVGEYRVVYDFDDSQVRVLVLGKRNDGEVYKTLARKG